MEFHELSSLFPEMNEEEYRGLVESIKKNGLREPIVIYKGKILDGKNRYKACMEAGVEPKFIEFQGNDPFDYVLDKNLHRRHLNAAQRGEIAFKYLEFEKKRAKERQRQAAIQTNAQLNRLAKDKDAIVKGNSLSKPDGLCKPILETQNKNQLLSKTLPPSEGVSVSTLAEGRNASVPTVNRNTSPTPQKEKQKSSNKELVKEELTHFQKKDVPTKNSQKNNDILSPDKGKPSGKSGEAIKLAAKKLEISHNTLYKIKKIKEAAQHDDEIAKAWEEAKKGHTSVNEVYKKVKAKNQEVKRKEKFKQIKELSEIHQKFAVIYADPPWQYEHSISKSRSIEAHYPTMSLEQICNLPVQDITLPDAVLFLWATSPKLPEALKVIEAWGFRYRTSVVWIKNKIGMGYYVRGRHEFLLIATKGKMPPPPPERRFDSVIEAPVREHSQKPDEAYERIEKMYPDLPKIELFARRKREGWTVWGNEVE